MYGFYFASCMNIIFNELRQKRVIYDVHTTRKIKSIHAIFITYCFYCLFIRDFNWNYFVMHINTIRWP